MISIYDFPRKHIARTLFGDDTPKSIRRVDAMLDGDSKMTVDMFWTILQLEPMIDVRRSLRDLYERYEMATWRKAQRAKDKTDEG